MIMPAPVREMARPRKQRIPMVIAAVVGVASLVAVVSIAMAVDSPSQAALPVVAPPPVAATHGNHSNDDVRYLRHHLPVPPGARKVRATLHRRVYTAPGDVARVVSYYADQLGRLKLHWNVTVHTPGAGRVAGRDGATVATLRVDRVPGTHGALVRIVVVFSR